MQKFGLIGKTLTHSWSKRWFDETFLRQGISDAQYMLYELPNVHHLRDWAAAEGVSGFNVTIPYKEAVIPLLDTLDETAQAIGAVNCVTLQDGRLIGHNTDAPAFAQTLKPLLQSWHSHALILGTGGASKAVAYALQDMGIPYLKVSRNPERHPGTISYLQASQQATKRLLIINTTPVGMYPDVTSTPWPYTDRLGVKHLCYDLIYNPQETRFIFEAQRCGARVCNGLAMLERQAQLSWELYQQVKKR